MGAFASAKTLPRVLCLTVVAFGLTAPNAAWGRLRIDTTLAEVHIDDITIRRRFAPESGPVTVEAGEVETKP